MNMVKKQWKRLQKAVRKSMNELCSDELNSPSGSMNLPNLDAAQDD